MKQTLETIRSLVSHISFEIFGQKLFISILEDQKYADVQGRRRPYMQVFYTAPCSKTGNIEEWRGGKHYLTEHMTDDEIVKKAWAAIQAAVHHEVMEGFKFDDTILFNPHVDFRKLIEVSPHEVKREQNFDV